MREANADQDPRRDIGNPLLSSATVVESGTVRRPTSGWDSAYYWSP